MPPIQSNSTGTVATDTLDAIKRLVAQTLKIEPNQTSSDLHVANIANVVGDLPPNIFLADALERWAKLNDTSRTALGCEGFLSIINSLGTQAASGGLTQPAAQLDPDDPVALANKAIKTTWQLYNEGKFVPCLDHISDMDQNTLNGCSPDQRAELLAITAWCHYRRHDYPAALAAIQKAENNSLALECEYYIRMYQHESYGDPARLAVLETVVGNTLAGANATVIRARSLEPIPYDLVDKLIDRQAPLIDLTNPPVAYANLLHNAARAYMERPRTTADNEAALVLLKTSILCYGSGDLNLHHRAAAHFWLSKLYENLNDLPRAVEAAVTSEDLWIKQLQLETQNPGNFDKLRNARKRTAELRQLSEQRKTA